jgi:hypothetical protein
VIIEIALGKNKHRLLWNPGEDYSKLAADFARENGLDSKLEEKLLNQLKISLQNHV